MFKVAIMGGEATGDYLMFKNKCVKCLKNQAKNGIMIYSTGDKFVNAFAERYGISIKTFPLDIQTYGRNAFDIRNETMFKDCDGLIYFSANRFYDQKIIEQAKNAGLSIRNIILPSQSDPHK